MVLTKFGQCKSSVLSIYLSMYTMDLVSVLSPVRYSSLLDTGGSIFHHLLILRCGTHLGKQERP